MRRRQEGFIDPLSLISLGFLIISLLVGAVVINKQNTSYDIRNKAATCNGTCVPGVSCVDEGMCDATGSCSGNQHCCRTCPTPTSAPTAAPTCNGTCVPGVSCVDEGMCGATGSCSNNQHCCRTCPTPTSTPTCGGLYDPCCGAYPAGSCNGGLYCSNLDGGTCLASPAPTPQTCSGCSANYKYCHYTYQSTTNCTNYQDAVYTKNCSCTTGTQACSVNTSSCLSTLTPFVKCCPKNNSASALNTCPGASESNCKINASVCEPMYGDNPNAQCGATQSPSPSPPACGHLWEACCGSGSCNSGLYCSNIDGGTCMTKVCTAGQKQCSGNSLGLCKADGSGWNYSLCPYGCANNACKSAPSPSPTPTTSIRCSSFGACYRETYVCEKNYGQLDCGNGYKCGVHCSTPTPSCSNAGVSGICSSLNCCPGLTKAIGMYGSCQCKVAPTSSPIPIPRCSSFGSCFPVNYTCERSYGQLDCRDSQKCGVHCSAPVTPQCSNLCRVDPCCKCTTCNGNTALECSTVCNIQLPSPVPTSTNIPQPSSNPTLTPTSTSTPIPTPTPFSPLGLCEVTEQCPGGYTCLNSHCVNNVEIEQCAADATVLANAAVGSNGITLDASYVPPNLVDIRTAVPNAMYANYEILIQQDAVADINCLVDGLLQNGYDPVISYGYRSYELQTQLHETYGDQAATAGNSQHQTGLAFDIHWYATENPDGTIEWISAYTDNGLSEPTELAISIAAECGIAHPLGWDAPHFFDVTAACPGLDTFVASIQNPTATYYDELNALIAQIQQRCLQGL